ncbi:N-acetyltransferase [Sulfolobales archaeon HS-7]|nr:N-acetyltransferase [Sulfolobales archaeon HS-7]
MQIRRAEEKDVEFIVDMFSRMYSLNSEFDPLLEIPDDIDERLRKSIIEDLRSENSVVVVAEDEGKVIGAARVRINKRRYYVPEAVALIEEIYVMPAYRREGVGDMLLNYVSQELKKKNVRSITARFPAKNLIAVSFYKKRDFREIHYEFIKKLE